MIREKLKKQLQDSFAKSIIELKLLTNRIADGKGYGEGVFTVKYQMLYLIAFKDKISPQELIFELKMAKSNLALMANKMIKEGLIESSKEQGNRKQIYYSITNKGKKALNVKMEAINNMQTEDSKEMLAHLEEVIASLKSCH